MQSLALKDERKLKLSPEIWAQTLEPVKIAEKIQCLLPSQSHALVDIISSIYKNRAIFNHLELPHATYFIKSSGLTSDAVNFLEWKAILALSLVSDSVEFYKCRKSCKQYQDLSIQVVCNHLSVCSLFITAWSQPEVHPMYVLAARICYKKHCWLSSMINLLELVLFSRNGIL